MRAMVGEMFSRVVRIGLLLCLHLAVACQKSEPEGSTCAATGAACTNVDCCSGACVDGTCVADPPSCAGMGASCEIRDCCSGTCSGGKCVTEVTVQPPTRDWGTGATPVA